MYVNIVQSNEAKKTNIQIYSTVKNTVSTEVFVSYMLIFFSILAFQIILLRSGVKIGSFG